MSSKLPNPRDKGRCSRCCLMYFGLPPRRSEGSPAGNVCFKYGDYCARVAWNCQEPSDGLRKSMIKKEVLEKIKSLALPKEKICQY